MLKLQLKTGEYVTIGSDVVVQMDSVSGDRCKLMIQAPKEVPILRGELLERAGGDRPDCVFEASRPRRCRGLAWNRNKTQALIAMRRQLREMDDEDEGVKALRRQLDFIFPPEFVSNETIRSPE